MRTETALNHKRRVIGQIKSLVHSAEVSGISSEEFNTCFLEIMETIRHCPQWVQSYCEGYMQAELDFIRQRKHLFGGYLNGVFYSCDRSRDDYYAKHGIEPLQWAEKSKGGDIDGIGHYWKHSLKPWFI